MPELPEVETVRRGLSPAMEGRRIKTARANRPDLRFPLPEDFANRLTGATISRLGRRAKFLAADLDTGDTLIMHLGMSGRFTVDGHEPGAYAHDTGANPAHDHVVFEMEGGATVTYNDPRRFGFMDLWPTDQLDTYRSFAGMGPEPLSNTFSAAHLDDALRGKATPIKAALLDQRVVAGLGNIYVCEALFRSGISPKRKANSVAGVRASRLAPAINETITEAIEAGGSTLRDFASTNGALGYFQHRFKVYGREGEPCPTCNGPIRRIVQSGRSTFYCRTCQR
ncbi:MAG: bifunctional DNA-formamidopyrimidine glycosylase/DNA-(apurinic or apyrimidinic site) lyase [Pseudomonadota bacterium]